ncbi:MAG: hypothetical protein Q3997_00155 [Propionibacteriaceae bacterium]|nr:hypothetical protein [Propionibacteriaceae bacterium]
MRTFDGDSPIPLPRGWAPVEPPAQLPSAEFAALGPAGHGGICPSVVFTRTELDGRSFEEWTLASAEAARQLIPSLFLIDRQPAHIGGYPGVMQLSAFTLEGRNHTQQQFYCQVAAQAAAVLTLTCSSADFDRLSAVFNELADHFDPEWVSQP